MRALAKMIVAGTRAGLSAQQVLEWPLELVVAVIEEAGSLNTGEPAPAGEKENPKDVYQRLIAREWDGD